MNGDTTAEAHGVQLAAYRAMGAERRSVIAARMSEDARKISEAGIRKRHPEYSESEVRHALNLLILGAELFSAAWPSAPLLAP